MLDEIREHVLKFETIGLTTGDPAVKSVVEAASLIVKRAQAEIEKSEVRAQQAEETLEKVREHMATFQARAETAEAEAATAVAALKHYLHLRSKEKRAIAKRAAWTFVSTAEFKQVQRDVQKVLHDREQERLALVENLSKMALAADIVVNLSTGHAVTEKITKRREEVGRWCIYRGQVEPARFETRSEALAFFHENYPALQKAYDETAGAEIVFGPAYDASASGEVAKSVAAAKEAITPGMTDTSTDARDELEDPQGRRPRHPVTHPEDD